jgi:hypothetical protein
VAEPDCFKTFGWLGAVASVSTAQRGAPFPVASQTQPDGALPTLSISKLTVCENAHDANEKEPTTINNAPSRISCLFVK